MSGVGVSGLLANLPGTVTPYPTQDPALELGGYRSVANAAARDAIPANFRSIGMAVTLQDTGVEYKAIGGIANANWVATGGTAGAVAPFPGEYFVNPGFAGIQTGSAANPFTTIAAAIAAGVAAAQATTRIYTSNITENVTLPTTGNWEICGIAAVVPSTTPFGVTITGNVVVSATANSSVAFQDVNITGTLTGSVATGIVRRIRLTGCIVLGATTLTGVGTGVFRCLLMGRSGAGDGNGFGGFLNGLLTLTGPLNAFNYFLTGLSLASGFNHHLDYCDLTGSTAITFTGATDTALYITNTRNVGMVFTVAGGGTGSVFLDDVTTSYALGIAINEGVASVGITAPASVQIIPGLGSSNLNSTTLANNRAAATVAKKTPIELMIVRAVLTLLTPGTLGSAVLNVVYTDLTGAVVTRAVTGVLNIAGAAGTTAEGQLVFAQNGATDINYTVTGIVTPGALSYHVSVSVGAAG